MKKKIIYNFFNSVLNSPSFFIILIITLQAIPVLAQDNNKSVSLLDAAKEIMRSAKYCALITIDDSGHPQARMMDPFAPEDDFIVWLGTNKNSRKVREIKANSKVTLYYQALNGAGYVSIKGLAVLVNDKESTSKYWKDEWKQFYSDGKVHYILIKIVPQKLEIVSYKHNLTGDPLTWEAPSIDFNTQK